MKYKFIIVLLLINSAKIHGQTDTLKLLRFTSKDLKVIDIEERIKVSSASRSQRSVTEIPSTIHIITGEEIRLRGYITLVDALKSVPGIRVSQPGSVYEGETFLMRGLFGNSNVKILINNIPIQPYVSGLLPIGEQLPIAQADRIEVVYGPASALYGADAMAGVINIITKQPKDRTFGEINVQKAADGYQHFNFLVGGKAGRDKNLLQYSIYGNFASRRDRNLKFGEKNIFEAKKSALQIIGFSKLESEELVEDKKLTKELIKEGFPFFKDSVEQPKIEETPHISRLLGVNLKFRNLSFSFNELYREDYSSIGLNPYVYSYTRPEGTAGETIQRFTLSYEKSRKNFNLTLNSSYLRFFQNKNSYFNLNFETLGEGRGYFYQESNDIFNEVLLQYKLREHSEITFGTSYLFSGYLPNTNLQNSIIEPSTYIAFSRETKILDSQIGDFGYYPQISSVLGSFIQYYYNKPKVSILASLRYDIPSEYENQLYSRLGITYNFSQRITTRASVGFAFKAPVPNLSYASTAFYDVDSDSVRYEQVPNPNLTPERLSAYEAGIRYQISPQSFIDLSFFSQSIDELITSRSLELDRTQYPNASVFEEDNIPRARSNLNSKTSQANLDGVQLFVQLSSKPFGVKTLTQLNATLSSGYETLPENGRRLDRHRMQPLFISKWNLSFYPNKKLFIHFENQLMSDWYKRYAPTDEFEEQEMEVNGYYNLDITLRYNINSHINFFTRTTNVFNNRFGGIGAVNNDLALFENPQMGRVIRFGIHISTNSTSL